MAYAFWTMLSINNEFLVCKQQQAYMYAYMVYLFNKYTSNRSWNLQISPAFLR